MQPEIPQISAKAARVSALAARKKASPLRLLFFVAFYVVVLLIAYQKLLKSRTRSSESDQSTAGSPKTESVDSIALATTILAARGLTNGSTNRFFLDKLNSPEQQEEIRALVYASEEIRYTAMNPRWYVQNATGFESQVMKTLIRLAQRERKQRITTGEATAFYYPGVFLLGSPKTSSTLMWKVLTSHPQLCSACGTACAPKRPGRTKRSYYSPDMCNCKEVFPVTRTVSSYLSHFGLHPKCIALSMLPEAPPYDFVDGTPMLADPRAPEKMFNMTPPALQPHMRFVVLIREPVSRALSAYNHLVKGSNRSSAGFEHRMDKQMEHLQWGGSVENFVTPGLAALHVRRWLERFPRKQFLVLQYDHIMAHTAAVIANVTDFLGLDPWDEEWLHGTLARNPKIGKDFGLRNLSCSALQRYSRFFQPYNLELYELMAATRAEAPTQEPPFQKFNDPVAHCT